MKQCTSCKKDLPLSEFNRQAKSPDGLTYFCRDCVKVRSSEAYRKNASKYKERASKNKPERVEKARRHVLHYLRTHPCVDCGATDPRVLEFDHLRDKVQTISRLTANGMSCDTIQKEIDKCEVRCCNCHRIKTYERAGNTWHSLLESVG